MRISATKNPPSGTTEGRTQFPTCRSYSLFRLAQRRNVLTPREPRLKLMPEGNLIFPQLPAQADIPPLVTSDKIDQAGGKILQLAADFGQLIHILLKQLDAMFKPRLEFL